MISQKIQPVEKASKKGYSQEKRMGERNGFLEENRKKIYIVERRKIEREEWPVQRRTEK